ncbi:TolC family protein [Terriglobus tenax]|uniref:TolC family protein n=1 Tax=Terriglobus tenax TaxID=1111115 RepID=UPI0021E0E0EF|nr:TolC family protein [Terriglobus tenax]
MPLLPASLLVAQSSANAPVDAGTPAQTVMQQTTAAASELRLTLDEALAMARRNSPRLQEALAATQRSQAGVLAARAYSNPTMDIYFGPQYARPIATPGTPGLLQHYSGTQTIEIPSERTARRKAAEFQVSSARAAEQGIGLNVMADAQRAFYIALKRLQEIRQARENLTLVEDLRRRVEVEVSVGEKGRLELTRAEAELARARFAVNSAQIEYTSAIALLRAAIAAPADANLVPVGSIDGRAVLPALDTLRDQVLVNHPAVLQSQADLKTSQATLDREKAMRIPRPTFFAEFENQPDLRYWRTGFSVPIPVFDRRRGEIADAKASISQSNAVLDQRRLELVSSLERAYEQYQLANQQVSSLEAGSLRAAESAVEAAKSAYRFGERGIVEVLDAQRVLQSVRGDLLDAQFARQSALIDLEELGALTPGAKP